LKFLGPNGLNIPCAVITDADPNVRTPGLPRIKKLLEHLASDEHADLTTDGEVIDLGKLHGLFLTDHTFEVALFRSGRHPSFAKTMAQLSSNLAAKMRANRWKANPTNLDVDKMLKDIEAIGKGRFSQRWALHVARSKSKHCPTSVREALNYVASRIQSQALPGRSGGT
jgi:putative ATP-dependent endonuclease of OLD family